MSKKVKIVLDVLITLVILGGIGYAAYFVLEHQFFKKVDRGQRTEQALSIPVSADKKAEVGENAGEPGFIQIHSTGDEPKVSNLSAGNLTIVRIHNPKILKTAREAVPKREQISSVISRYPDAVIMNTSGFNMETGRLTGLQINNGQQLTKWAANSMATYALTVNNNGTFSLYDNQTTGAQMIENGAMESFSFGMALIKDGQAQENDGTVNWEMHTFIGYDADNNLYLVISKTFTPYDEIISGLAPYGLQGLILQDGDGSSQMAVAGEVIFPSQDQRAVADYIVVR